MKEKRQKKSKLKQVYESVKEIFSHNEERTIKEMGTRVLGGSFYDANKYLSTQQLLVASDFVRCVQILARDLSKIEFDHLEEKKINGSKHFFKTKESKWHKLWNINPSNDLSPSELKKVIVWNLILYGAAAIWIVKDLDGEPTELIPIYRNYINRVFENGAPRYKINISGYTENSDQANKNYIDEEMWLEDDEIIWIPYEIMDNYKNVEVRNLFSTTINKMVQNDLSMLNAFQNDTGLSMIIKTKGYSSEEQKSQIASNLKEASLQMKQTGMLAFIIDDKMEVLPNTAFTASPISIDFRNKVVMELASRFGIPPIYLGIETPNTSIAQLNRIYLDVGFEPLANTIVEKISYSIFKNKSGNKISYSTRKLAGLDYTEKITAASQAINAGLMTLNEGREWLDLPAVEEGNQLFVNAATQPLNNLISKSNAETKKLESEASKFDAETTKIESESIKNKK